MNMDGMNETDVREVIVRPFLEQLGYRYGTEAHIRTEYPLRYSRAFLGRKDEKRDPNLRGRADYACEVVSHGRWVVEVKAPHKELDLEDSQQAYTYAAHPEIADEVLKEVGEGGGDGGELRPGSRQER
jgi:predicted type IV restriction endonuclease